MYFSWGNTIGEQWDSDYGFTAALYEGTAGSSVSEDLTLANDAARMTLGGLWRMPSTEDFAELVANTEKRWTIKEGVPGLLFTSLINGQSIFLPAMGYHKDERKVSVGTEARFWTRNFYDNGQSYNANFRDGQYSANSRSPRYVGYNIRAVRDD